MEEVEKYVYYVDGARRAVEKQVAREEAMTVAAEEARAEGRELTADEARAEEAAPIRLGRAVHVETCVCKHGTRRRWRV